MIATLLLSASLLAAPQQFKLAPHKQPAHAAPARQPADACDASSVGEFFCHGTQPTVDIDIRHCGPGREQMVAIVTMPGSPVRVNSFNLLEPQKFSGWRINGIAPPSDSVRFYVDSLDNSSVFGMDLDPALVAQNGSSEGNVEIKFNPKIHESVVCSRKGHQQQRAPQHGTPPHKVQSSQARPH